MAFCCCWRTDLICSTNCFAEAIASCAGRVDGCCSAYGNFILQLPAGFVDVHFCFELFFGSGLTILAIQVAAGLLHVLFGVIERRRGLGGNVRQLVPGIVRFVDVLRLVSRDRTKQLLLRRVVVARRFGLFE